MQIKEILNFFVISGLIVSALLSLSAFAAPHTIKYTYDALGRLTFVEDNTNGNRDYDYDKAGNRLWVAVGTAKDDVPILRAPMISPYGGSYVGFAIVTLSSSESGATIRYTTNNTNVTSNSPVYNGAFTLTDSTVVSAKAFRSDARESPQVTASFTITPPPVVAKPVITAASTLPGNPSSPVAITISTTTPGATIRYTLDNTPVTATSQSDAQFTITSTATIRARAFKTGFITSDEAVSYREIQGPPGPPIITPTSATHVGAVTVSLGTGISGAMIRYTTNNTAVTSSSPLYGGPFALTSSTVVRARAFSSSGGSAESSRYYTVTPYPMVATPIINPSGGSYLYSVSVSLSVATSGATIRYTTNGVDVTESSSKYVGPFTLKKHTQIKTRAFKSGMSGSGQMMRNFTIYQLAPPAGLEQSKGSPYHYNIAWNAVAGAIYYDVRLSDGNRLKITNANSRVKITNTLAATWVRACITVTNCSTEAYFPY